MGAIFAFASIGLTAVTGCGSGLADGSATRALFIAECGGGSADKAELITLDWGGGVTALYPGKAFGALDLSLFETLEGRTLADDAVNFKERVREQITRIYCDSSAPAIKVVHADDLQRPGDTVVQITQGHSPQGASEVGEAEYDPCNNQHDNTAVIYGEEIRQLNGTATFDEWVAIFANITAHEIAHTLGYNHVDRRTFIAAADRPLYVELMLDGHTIRQLRSEQRFMVEQNICP